MRSKDDGLLGPLQPFFSGGSGLSFRGGGVKIASGRSFGSFVTLQGGASPLAPLPMSMYEYKYRVQCKCLLLTLEIGIPSNLLESWR